MKFEAKSRTPFTRADMFREINAGKEITYEPGDMFAAYGTIHVLKEVHPGESPSGNECEEYIAVCGFESQSWAIPVQHIESAAFIKPDELKSKEKLARCPTCFSLQADDEPAAVSWRTRLTELIKEPNTAEDRVIAAELAAGIDRDFNHGDRYVTSVSLYVNAGKNKAQLYVGYEDNSRMKDSGLEDTMGDLLQAQVIWKDADPTENDHVAAEIKRSMLLSQELKKTLIITSYPDRVRYYIHSGDIHEDNI